MRTSAVAAVICGFLRPLLLITAGGVFPAAVTHREVQGGGALNGLPVLQAHLPADRHPVAALRSKHPIAVLVRIQWNLK